METIPFYTGEEACKALRYLLTEVRYKPDEVSYKDEDGMSCPIDLMYLIERGGPKKPRFQLRDGDYAVNEHGYCCGHYQEGEIWIAFDNSTGDCWVEEFHTEQECIDYLKGEDRKQYYYLDYLYREIGLLPEDIETVPESDCADDACSVIADKGYVQKQLEDIPDDKLFEAVKSLCDNPELTTRKHAIEYIVWMVALGIKEEQMTEIRKLTEIEQDSIALDKELKEKLRQIISYADKPIVKISQDRLTSTDPTFVYFSDNNLEHYEGQVLSVTLHHDGDLSFDVGETCPEMTLYLSECHTLFNVHTWLINICENLIDALGLDHKRLSM